MDAWHFSREQFAEFILTGMKNQLLERVTLFAPRKSGKTQFITKDIQPLCANKKLLSVYIDFWKDKANPEAVFIEAVILAIESNKNWFKKGIESLGLNAELGLTGIKLGLVSKNKNSQVELTLSGAYQLLDNCSVDVVLLLDEVQHLATDTKFENFTASLRSFMANRADSKIKGVFTGSSQEGLSRLFKKTNAPFYDSSQKLDFSPLGDEFVKFELSVFKKVTGGGELNFNEAKKIFAAQYFSPGRFVGLLKQMALNQVHDLLQGQRLFEVEFLEAENQEFNSVLAELSDLDIYLLANIAKGEAVGLYGSEFSQKASSRLAKKVNKTSIQNSILKLSDNGLIYSFERGVWKIDDPAFANYVSLLV